MLRIEGEGSKGYAVSDRRGSESVSRVAVAVTVNRHTANFVIHTLTYLLPPSWSCRSVLGNSRWRGWLWFVRRNRIMNVCFCSLRLVRPENTFFMLRHG